MAKLSKRQAAHARTKRENSLLRRVVAQGLQAQGQATALILGLLAQAGGTVVLKQETLDQVNRDIKRMGYQVGLTEEKLPLITLVLQDSEPDEAPSAPEVPSGKIVLTD